MAINFNFKIEKKDLWLLAAIFVFLAGVTYVIAWGSGNPSVMGHSIDESLYIQTYSNVNHTYVTNLDNHAVSPDTHLVSCTKGDAAAYCAEKGQIFVSMTCKNIDAASNIIVGIYYARGHWEYDDHNKGAGTERAVDTLNCAWGFNGPISDVPE